METEGASGLALQNLIDLLAGMDAVTERRFDMYDIGRMLSVMHRDAAYTKMVELRVEVDRLVRQMGKITEENEALRKEIEVLRGEIKELNEGMLDDVANRFRLIEHQVAQLNENRGLF